MSLDKAVVRDVMRESYQNILIRGVISYML